MYCSLLRFSSLVVLLEKYNRFYNQIENIVMIYAQKLAPLTRILSKSWLFCINDHGVSVLYL